MLKRIEIQNYKSIEKVNLLVENEVVVVGPNGVGKSNLLDALNFVRDAARDGLDQAVATRHGIKSIRRWSKTKPYHVTIKLSFELGRSIGFYSFTLASTEGDYSIHEEEAYWYGPSIITGSGSQFDTYNFHRSKDGIVKLELPQHLLDGIKPPPVFETDLLLSQLAPNNFSIIAAVFSNLYSEITSSGAYSIYPNSVRGAQPISNAQVLFDDGSNLASVVRRMRSTTHRANKELLTQAMQQVLPILQEIKIDTAGGFYVPVFKVREQENGQAHELNMSQVSDGTLRMLGMLTAFYQPAAPRRITVEEPEQMVHPGLLSVLTDAARDYLSQGQMSKQCFFTTHSPTLLDAFDIKSIVAASFENGVSSFCPMSERQRKIVNDNLFSAGELLIAEGIF